MIKFVFMLMLAIVPLCSESIDEMKNRLLNEIDRCDDFVDDDKRIACQMKIKNKIMLLNLVEKMKEDKKNG